MLDFQLLGTFFHIQNVFSSRLCFNNEYANFGDFVENSVHDTHIKWLRVTTDFVILMSCILID